MKPWCEDKKAKIVQFYFETVSHFDTTEAPQVFQGHGSDISKRNFSDCKRVSGSGDCSQFNFKQHSGCKSSQRTSPTVALVRYALQRTSHKSMRRLGLEIWCSRATAQWMATVDTKLLQLNHSLCFTQVPTVPAGRYSCSDPSRNPRLA